MYRLVFPLFRTWEAQICNPRYHVMMKSHPMTAEGPDNEMEGFPIAQGNTVRPRLWASDVMRSGKCVRTKAQLTRPRARGQREKHDTSDATRANERDGTWNWKARSAAPILNGKSRYFVCTTRCSHYHFGYANVNRPTYHGRDASCQLRLSAPMESRRRSVTPSWF